MLEPFGLSVGGEQIASGKVHVVSRPTKLTRFMQLTRMGQGS